MSQVVVVIGGGPLSPRAIADVAHDATIIAADSGLDHAVAAGLRPTILVGDLDSISAHGKMWAYAHELEIDQHPVDKGATDTELALARAAGNGGDGICSSSARLGDRFDHVLGHAGRARQSAAGAVRRDSRLRSARPRSMSCIPGRSVTIDLPQDYVVLAARAPRRLPRRRGDRSALAAERCVARAVGALSGSATSNRLLHVAVADGILTLVVP